MKKCSIALLALILMTGTLNAQTALEKNRDFTGAVPKKKFYRAIYQLDSNDPKIIGKAIRNINNALTDPRLAGRLQIELVTFAGGTDAAMKGSQFEEELKALAEKGVIVAQCSNSLHERKLTRDQIYDFFALVPSGNGELILRQAEGWAIVKP